MQIKMIVTDLDGTLLRTDKTISEYTKAILRKCRESGVKMVYATGRGGSAQRVAPSEFFDGKITMNGAVAKIGDDVVYNCLIPYEVARPILVACDKRGMKITSEISGMHHSNFVVSDRWSLITNYTIVEFLRHDIDAEKIYLPDPALEDRKFIEQLLPDSLYFVVTADGDGFLGQIMHKDATKSKAVSKLARLWGISPKDIVAFGDELNDVDLLAYAGTGVAMGNGLDEVKAAADYICDTNDNDGAARWLEAHVLKGR
jgi:Cof subfamily protein (haloacid dehalogenase superfamily)